MRITPEKKHLAQIEDEVLSYFHRFDFQTSINSEITVTKGYKRNENFVGREPNLVIDDILETIKQLSIYSDVDYDELLTKIGLISAKTSWIAGRNKSFEARFTIVFRVEYKIFNKLFRQMREPKNIINSNNRYFSVEKDLKETV